LKLRWHGLRRGRRRRGRSAPSSETPHTSARSPGASSLRLHFQVLKASGDPGDGGQRPPLQNGRCGNAGAAKCGAALRNRSRPRTAAGVWRCAARAEKCIFWGGSADLRGAGGFGTLRASHPCGGGHHGVRHVPHSHHMQRWGLRLDSGRAVALPLNRPPFDRMLLSGRRPRLFLRAWPRTAAGPICRSPV